MVDSNLRLMMTTMMKHLHDAFTFQFLFCFNRGVDVASERLLGIDEEATYCFKSLLASWKKATGRREWWEEPSSNLRIVPKAAKAPAATQT